MKCALCPNTFWKCILTICVSWQLVFSDPLLFFFYDIFLQDCVILWGLAKCPNCLINIFHLSHSFTWITFGLHIQHAFTIWTGMKKGAYLETSLVSERARHLYSELLGKNKKQAKESCYTIPDILLWIDPKLNNSVLRCHSIFQPKCFLKSSGVNYIEEIDWIWEKKSLIFDSLRNLPLKIWINVHTIRSCRI